MSYGNKKYVVLAEIPDNMELSIVNATQLLHRQLIDKPPLTGEYEELAIDREKLDQCKVLDITLDKPKVKKLFMVGKL